MTARELLDYLKKLEWAELNYTVLLEVDAGWVQLGSISKDFGMRTIDLIGAQNEEGEDDLL